MSRYVWRESDLDKQASSRTLDKQIVQHYERRRLHGCHPRLRIFRRGVHFPARRLAHIFRRIGGRVYFVS